MVWAKDQGAWHLWSFGSAHGTFGSAFGSAHGTFGSAFTCLRFVLVCEAPVVDVLNALPGSDWSCAESMRRPGDFEAVAAVSMPRRASKNPTDLDWGSSGHHNAPIPYQRLLLGEAINIAVRNASQHFD
jgi:hypothetical protein